MMRFKLGFLCILPLSLLIGCGRSKSLPNFNESPSPVILPADGSNIDGLYMAKFETLNGHVNGTIPGSATIQRQGNKFYAYVRLFGGTPETWHQQYVYLGNRCPSLKDDANGDGFIDIVEANAVWGDAILPLDANISSQGAGKNIFPMSDDAGSYFYERVTNFDKLFEDLKNEDRNFEDNVAKLNLDSGLAIEGRAVAVLGIADTVELPETVASEPSRLSAHQTLPIVCGIFKRVTEIPGEEYDETIPGPVEPGEEETDMSPNPEDPYQPETEEDNGDYWPSEDEEDHVEEYEEEEDEVEQPAEEEENSWDDVIDWWRSRWERWTRDRHQEWGNGRSWLSIFDR